MLGGGGLTAAFNADEFLAAYHAALQAGEDRINERLVNPDGGCDARLIARCLKDGTDTLKINALRAANSTVEAQWAKRLGKTLGTTCSILHYQWDTSVPFGTPPKDAVLNVLEEVGVDTKGYTIPETFSHDATDIVKRIPHSNLVIRVTNVGELHNRLFGETAAGKTAALGVSIEPVEGVTFDPNVARQIKEFANRLQVALG